MTIYVIDNHPLMRDAIATILRRCWPEETIIELDRIGAVKDAIDNFGLPELILLDLKLPDASGCSGIKTLRMLNPDAPIAIYTAAPAHEMKHACLVAGADVFIEKSASATELLKALRGLLMDDHQDAQLTTDGSSKLSKRQGQLILMLDKGLSNRDIAINLEISEHTVKVHLWRLFRRIGVKSRTQALHHARSHGLLSAM